MERKTNSVKYTCLRESQCILTMNMPSTHVRSARTAYVFRNKGTKRYVGTKNDYTAEKHDFSLNLVPKKNCNSRVIMLTYILNKTVTPPVAPSPTMEHESANSVTCPVFSKGKEKMKVRTRSEKESNNMRRCKANRPTCTTFGCRQWRVGRNKRCSRTRTNSQHCGQRSHGRRFAPLVNLRTSHLRSCCRQCGTSRPSCPTATAVRVPDIGQLKAAQFMVSTAMCFTEAVTKEAERLYKQTAAMASAAAGTPDNEEEQKLQDTLK